jgi:uncharacterized protein with PIN domain
MGGQTARVRVAEQLRFLLAARNRFGDVAVAVNGVSSLLHLVESLGVPRTEVGEVRMAGLPVALHARPRGGDLIEVLAVRRPQRIADPRFVLDAHLGALARRMRLLGLDASYRNDVADAELVAQAAGQQRILLTQDRGVLRRRALPVGAYVHGSDPDDQLMDVLDRFDPPLAPWSRCLACNGLLEPVEKERVQHLLQPGTRRSYAQFARCRECGRVYWRGAHARRLDAIVARAVNRRQTAVSRRSPRRHRPAEWPPGP